MKNVDIKKALMNDIKYCDEYIIYVWAWTDRDCTWAEVIAYVDGEYMDGYDIENIPYYEKPDGELSDEEKKLIAKEIKKTGNYLKKHFNDVNVITEIQWV